MKRRRLPNTDSVEELAGFWDKHELTDFADELQEVQGPVFVRVKGASTRIGLPPTEVQQFRRIARSQSVKETTVLRQWSIERLHDSSGTPRAPRRSLRTRSQ